MVFGRNTMADLLGFKGAVRPDRQRGLEIEKFFAVPGALAAALTAHSGWLLGVPVMLIEVLLDLEPGRRMRAEVAAVAVWQ